MNNAFEGDSGAELKTTTLSTKTKKLYTFLHFSKPTFGCYSKDPGMPGYDSWSAQPWYLWYQECLCLAGRAWRPGCASSSAQPASGQTSPEAAIRLIYRLTFCLLTSANRFSCPLPCCRFGLSNGVEVCTKPTFHLMQR